MTPSWFSEIDHTGDVGISVTAPDRETLFERAAWAMFAVLTDPESVRPNRERVVEVDGTDRDDLMLRWLSELNFIHVTEGVLFSSFDVRQLSDHHLTAAVRGEPIDPARHVVNTEIKAVTYHALTVEQRDGGWFAQIIFDL